MRRPLSVFWWWWWKRRHAQSGCLQVTIESGDVWDSEADGGISDATGYVLTLIAGNENPPELAYWDGADWQDIGPLEDTYTAGHDRIQVTASRGDPTVFEYCAPSAHGASFLREDSGDMLRAEGGRIIRE